MSFELREIYLEKIQEAIQRLRASDSFLASYAANSELPNLEAAILQVRKALEAIAFASIAPNIEKYEIFRSRAADQPDFTKDYHAGKIFRVLTKINEIFFRARYCPPQVGRMEQFNLIGNALVFLQRNVLCQFTID